MSYTEESAVRKLLENRVGVTDKTITVPYTTGIKLWGCIDFLCKVHGYTWRRPIQK